MPPSIRLGSLVYRQASWHDWVNVLARSFWETIYKLRLSREEVVAWLKGFAEKLTARQAATIDTDFVPDTLVDQLANALAMVDLPSGMFIQALIKKISEKPPAGFRWELDDDGRHYLKRQHGGAPTTERPIAKGLKFIGQVFVGAWWHTDTPTSSATKQLQSALKKAGGGIFYKLKRPGVGVTEYYGYAIVPLEEALLLGQILAGLGLQLLEEGPTRDFRISAAKLDGFAEKRTVGIEDVITQSGIFKSEKFNWEFTITELLNGRNKGADSQDITHAVKMLLKEFEA
jgi:hypothetical protein